MFFNNILNNIKNEYVKLYNDNFDFRIVFS